LTWRDNSAVEEMYEVWGEWHEIPTCSSGSACPAVYYSHNWKLADLPANSTTFLCSGCNGSPNFRFAGIALVVKKGEFIAAAEWWVA